MERMNLRNHLQKLDKGVYDKIDAYYSIAPFILIGLIDYI